MIQIRDNDGSPRLDENLSYMLDSDEVPMLLSVPCALCTARADSLLIRERPEALILVDQAPVCEGHLLVVSAEHASSTADLRPSAKRALRDEVRRAIGVAAAIGGRPAFAIEHGRSPTCGDRSCACHAHVHVLPLGEPDLAMLEGGLLERRWTMDKGSYLALGSCDDKWSNFRIRRETPHVARTVAALIGDANGVSWRPLSAPPDVAAAANTYAKALHLYRSAPKKTQVSPRSQAAKAIAVPRLQGRKPVVVVCGSTGSGKTTTATHLARQLGVPAIELGVILRLAVGNRPADERALPGVLWRWSSNGRLDFDGRSTLGLAAAVPRLDGGAYELPMWTGIEADRLSALARRADVQEVLAAIAERIAKVSGAVIVGRLPPSLNGCEPQILSLEATARVRASRKRAQLEAIGVSASEHDWFSPKSIPAEDVEISDGTLVTTRLGIVEMCFAALRALDAEPRRLSAL